jgi:8-oxo-dGTP pyrophosphatase MutT (NUDIX family)
MKASELSPWRVKRSRHVHRDRWISVRADNCETANGVSIEPYYVLEYPDWVHLVGITPDREVVLVRQYRHGVRAITLELPAGNVDCSDPDPLSAAARELAEETGYVADELRVVAQLSPNPATHTNTIHVVLALNARPTRQASPDPTEEIAVEIIPCDAAIELVLSGAMIQALHVSSLLIALHAAGLLPARSTQPLSSKNVAG